MSVNKVLLLGNLTRDIEIKYLTNGTAVAKFSIAINRKFKQGDEMKEEVSYPNIVAWGKTAEFISKYFSKGQAIFIDGRLQTRTWEDKEGKKQYATEVIAEAVSFAGPKKESNQTQETKPEDNYRSQDEEVPF